MKMNQVVYNVRGNVGVWVDLVLVLLLMTPSTFRTGGGGDGATIYLLLLGLLLAVRTQAIIKNPSSAITNSSSEDKREERREMDGYFERKEGRIWNVMVWAVAWTAADHILLLLRGQYTITATATATGTYWTVQVLSYHFEGM